MFLFDTVSMRNNKYYERFIAKFLFVSIFNCYFCKYYQFVIAYTTE